MFTNPLKVLFSQQTGSALLNQDIRRYDFTSMEMALPGSARADANDGDGVATQTEGNGDALKDNAQESEEGRAGHGVGLLNAVAALDGARRGRAKLGSQQGLSITRMSYPVLH